MEGVILGWFVLVSTGSVLALAVFGSLQFLGTLISPLFGMAGDHFGNRNLLCLMRATYVVVSAALMVLFLAGVQTIPRELYESARMDGATSPQQLWYVTLPALGPTLSMVSILTMVGYFQLFAEPYVMTQGGPLQSTVSVLYLMYEEGFKWWNVGSASAVAFVLFLVIFALTVLQLRLARWEHAT